MNAILRQANEPREFLQNAFSDALIRSTRARASGVPQGVRKSVENPRNEALDEIRKGTLRPRNLALARGVAFERTSE